MLAADDRWPKERRFQARPMPRHEADRDGGKCQEMREPQHVEIGLVDRIHPIGKPPRYVAIERFEMPGQCDQESEDQISDRDHENGTRAQYGAELLRSAERTPGAE